jgi:hypothetical protein
MIRSLVFLLSVTLLGPAFGGEKIQNRNWQTGRLMDLQRSQDLAGTVERPGVVLTNGIRLTNNSRRAIYRRQETLVIETEMYDYTVDEVLGRRQQPANLTVNGPVTFAIEGPTLYLIDEDGRQYKTEVVRKALRTPEQAPTPKP